MNKAKLKKIEKRIEDKIDNKILLFRIFDEPRPKYIAKVTVIDEIINKVFLWMIPQTIKPNHITVFRFIAVPFIIFFFLFEYYKVAFILFVLAAFSDAVDGAMARTRNKITDWGIIFDPLADKFLIGSVGGILIFKFLSPTIACIIVLLETILLVTSYYRYKGEVVPAKTMGKLKMIFQCIGVGLVFLFLLTGNDISLIIATITLYIAVLFAVLSLLIYKSI